MPAMTETDAQQKWCPFSRVADEAWSNNVGNNVVVVVNRPFNSGYVKGMHCIGSDCMLWAWVQEVGGNGYCSLAND